MKKILFLCLVIAFNGLLFSCDKDSNSEELQLYNNEKTMATGGEDNEEEPESPK